LPPIPFFKRYLTKIIVPRPATPNVTITDKIIKFVFLAIQLSLPDSFGFGLGFIIGGTSGAVGASGSLIKINCVPLIAFKELS